MKTVKTFLAIFALASLSLWGQAPAPQGQNNCCVQCQQCPAPPTVKYVGPSQAQIREAVREELKGAIPPPQPIPPQQPIIVNPPAVTITAPQSAESDAEKALLLAVAKKLMEEPAPQVQQAAAAPTVTVDMSGVERRLDRQNQLLEIQNGYVRSTNQWTKWVIAPAAVVTAGATTYTAFETHAEVQQLKKLNNGIAGLGQTLAIGQSSIATAIAGIKPPVVTVDNNQTSTQTGATSSSTSASNPTVTANPTSSSVSSPTVTANPSSNSTSNPTVNNTNAGNGGQGGAGGAGGNATGGNATGGTATAQGGSTGPITTTSTGGSSSSVGTQNNTTSTTTNNSTTNNNTTVITPMIPPCGCE